jgi:hypothetical protein
VACRKETPRWQRAELEPLVGLERQHDGVEAPAALVDLDDVARSMDLVLTPPGG